MSQPTEERLTPGSDSAAEGASKPAQVVLIVDDSPVDRRIAGGIVEQAIGLHAAYAGDGREALAAIARQEPAVVLTDMQMPEMAGLELVEAIRKTYPRLPVVLMTAHGSEEVAMQALNAGAASYVPERSLAHDLAETLLDVLSAAAAQSNRRRIAQCIERSECALCLDNDPTLISPLIGLLQDDLDRVGFGDASTRMRVGIALQEALANALYHGNLEVSSDLRQDDEREFHSLADRRRLEEPYRSRRLHVRSLLDPAAVAFSIRDDGPGFDTAILDRPIDPEDLMRVGGRGLLLIRTFMDEVSFNAAGNQIDLVKRRQPPGPDTSAPAV